ncbi:jg20196 [Pararge aegeria aegeria]|uniref:Jg20196 protein n=1 Tax=Pararge aegeria aegeria TaxID=348720 RepID=A0A8S4S1C7_9NEOP|nr:jg20196 [Pararge aegeria aegeria]
MKNHNNMSSCPFLLCPFQMTSDTPFLIIEVKVDVDECADATVRGSGAAEEVPNQTTTDDPSSPDGFTTSAKSIILESY